MVWLFFSNAQLSTEDYRHINKQGNMAHSKEHKKSLETDLKERHTGELLDKDVKTIVLNMLS